MARKPETIFKEEKVLPFLKKLKNTWYVTVDMRAIRGIADIILCVHGHFVALELKRKGEKYTKTARHKLQAWNIEKIKAAGGFAKVVTPENWDATKEWLTAISQGEYYDNIDVRTNTQSKLRSGALKACEPSKFRASTGVQRSKNCRETADLRKRLRRHAQQHSEEDGSHGLGGELPNDEQGDGGSGET